jgi:hypothetical protein
MDIKTISVHASTVSDSIRDLIVECFGRREQMEFIDAQYLLTWRVRYEGVRPICLLESMVLQSPNAAPATNEGEKS